MFNNLKKTYSQKGYITIRNFFSEAIINNLNNEIKEAENVDKYFDKNNEIRRIERLFNKGKELNFVNQKILEILKNIFEEDYNIFKDKFNAKPPGGEGFFAHYDGVFIFVDKNNNKKNGWYEYSDYFINVLLALDPCNKKNGTIEISKIHNDKFENLLLNTKNNGTPDLLDEIENKLIFEPIELNIGDLVIFSNQCPHRSKKNFSNSSRRTLYYTYTPARIGSFYEKYFDDKKNSKNKTSKSLNGEI
jgi:ectoine hydroxylase-related dioxygenase (phytanoyl-CoA dioxygenase family)